jgi:hypothetical protein
VNSQPENASRFKELFKKYYVGFDSDQNDMSCDDKE